MLDQRFSPEQVSGRLRVCSRTISRCGSAMKRSIAASTSTRVEGWPASSRPPYAVGGPCAGLGVGAVPGPHRGAVSIAERPQEVEGRQVPGHHEGDLILGSRESNSAVATIVERLSGYLVLGHLPDGRGTEAVSDAVAEAMSHYPIELAKTLTWDQGIEMANHAGLTPPTGIDVYFADPYKPWQRGSNENINGLLREYLPKSTDLSTHSAADLAAIAHELNTRPRKRLGYLTPAEVLAKIQAKDQGVATTG